MNTHWEFIAECLRAELADYGGLLHLYEIQQRSLFDRDADSVLRLATEIETQALAVAGSRCRREQAVSSFATANDRPSTTTLRAMLPLIAAEARPLLEALINEVNALLHRVRRTSRHNHSLLSRAIEIHQDTLQHISPNSFTKTYSPPAACQFLPHAWPRPFGSRAETAQRFITMSGLFASLNASTNALGAQSRGVEIAGKNLANVNNATYARQRVVFGDLGTIATADGPESMGLQVLGVEQLRDRLLDQQVLREVSLSYSYQSEQQAYQRAQAGLGQSITGTAATGISSSTSDNGISAALDDYFNAFQSLAANPTDAGQRQTLIQRASILTDRIRLADQRLTQVQSDLGAQVTNDVSDANRIIQTIADLNEQIGRFEADNPGAAVDLRDQRQAALEQLAAKMPIEIRNPNAAEVQVVAKDGSGADVVLVNLHTVNGTVSFNGTQISAGSPATVLALSGGSIQGALAARDGSIQDLRDNLDALAGQLVTSVNAAYNPLGSTGDFFDAAGVTAGTIALDASLSPSSLKASDGGPAGDNSVALAIAALATKKFSTTGLPPDLIDGSFSGHLAKTVSDLGQALAGANARVDNQTNIERIVRTQRDGVSGVSLDEEMADLLKYQRAFQASSRVFGVIDNLLDVVVNRLGN